MAKLGFIIFFGLLKPLMASKPGYNQPTCLEIFSAKKSVSAGWCLYASLPSPLSKAPAFYSVEVVLKLSLPWQFFLVLKILVHTKVVAA